MLFRILAVPTMESVEKRRMCPNCRAFITVDDKTCPYCGIRLGERSVDRRAPEPILGIVPAQHFATGMILLLNLAMFIASLMLSAQREGASIWGFDIPTLVALGAKDRFSILYQGEWWRLLTAGFLHGGLVHIAFNTYGIMMLGPWVEESMGAARVAIIYVLTTISGFWASLLLTNSVSIGASAAIFGFLGALIGWGIRNRKTYEGRATRQYFWHAALYSLVLSAFIGNTDNFAHGGGLVGGIALGFVLNSPRLVTDIWERLVQALAIVCVGATVYSLGLIVLRLVQI